MIIYWDRRNGVDSHPFRDGVQRCQKCKAVLCTIDVEADYIARDIRCNCGCVVHLPGIEDRGRFAGLRSIIRDAEGLWPLFPGEVPVATSEHVRGEFEAIARCPLPGDSQDETY